MNYPFSESQIVATLRRPGLKQQGSGQTVAQIARQRSINEATLYGWTAKSDLTLQAIYLYV